MRTLYRAARIHVPGLVPAANALVVDGATIAWVGTAESIGSGAADRVIDLGGALVTAAFVDAHAHVTETGLLLRGVDLSAATTINEILDLVAAAARRGDDPILGHGWDETTLAGGRPPTSVELDRAAGGAEVYLARVDVHSAVISSALARSCRATMLDGWTENGRVERDAHHAARAATRETLTAQARRQAQLEALAAAAAHGIAAVHEMSAPHIAPDEDLRSLLALVAEAGPDEPGLPDVVPYRAELVDSPEQARAVGRRIGVHLAGLAGDLCVDGSVGSRTAAFHADYADARQVRGHLYLSAEQIRDHVAACTRVGFQAGFHVIGDAAVDVARRGIRRAAGRVGIAAVRAAGHRLEHVEAIDAEGIADLADLSVTASVQPAFDARWGGDSGMYVTRLGVERAQALNPFGAMQSAGVPLAFGSDSPVTPFDPWKAIRACVHHHVPRQRLDVAAAFAAHTIGGWRAARITGCGSLEPGAPAHFAAWDHAGGLDADGLPMLTPDSPSPQCLLTVAHGRRIFAS